MPEQARGAATGASNWWGETPEWAVAAHSPKAAARQVLVEACGRRGGLDDTGAMLDNETLFRRAKVCTHPDHRGGDRSAWDRVEAAAKVLGLIPYS